MKKTRRGIPANDDDTATALLRAGRDLFSRHGYDGASVRALSKAAGSNLGAITYHFGSKRALYSRVVADILDPLAEAVLAAAATAGPPLDRAVAVERAFFAYFANHPEAPRLMLQEFAAGRIPPETAIVQLRRMHAAMAALITEGQADGSMRAGNPALMAISIVSQPAHLHLVRLSLKASLGIDLLDPVTSQHVVENAVSFVRGGLAAQHG
jgi:AcrR family transcriptional regulator